MALGRGRGRRHDERLRHQPGHELVCPADRRRLLGHAQFRDRSRRGVLQQQRHRRRRRDPVRSDLGPGHRPGRQHAVRRFGRRRRRRPRVRCNEQPDRVSLVYGRRLVAPPGQPAQQVLARERHQQGRQHDLRLERPADRLPLRRYLAQRPDDRPRRRERQPGWRSARRLGRRTRRRRLQLQRGRRQRGLALDRGNRRGADRPPDDAGRRREASGAHPRSDAAAAEHPERAARYAPAGARRLLPPAGAGDRGQQRRPHDRRRQRHSAPARSSDLDRRRRPDAAPVATMPLHAASRSPRASRCSRPTASPATASRSAASRPTRRTTAATSSISTTTSIRSCSFRRTASSITTI